MNPIKLDHVAYWLADRDAVANFVTAHVGMHVIERTDTFTLLGSNARRGKITLFDAEPPRERGALKHVAFRVASLEDALAALPSGLELERQENREAYFDVGAEGVRFGLVESPTDVDYDLDHVALYSAQPAESAHAYESLGFAAAAVAHAGAPRVEVGGAWVEFHPGDPGAPEKPLLNHLAVLVESADDAVADAEELGIDVESVVEAANTRGAFLAGPEGVRIECVEHKPSFSLV